MATRLNQRQRPQEQVGTGVTVYEFNQRLQFAIRDEIPALADIARQLGDYAVASIASTIKVGKDTQVNIAVTVAIHASLTSQTRIQDAMIDALQCRADLMLHELILPELVTLVTNMRSRRASEALFVYAGRNDLTARLYARVIKSMGVNVRRYPMLPQTRIVGEIGPR